MSTETGGVTLSIEERIKQDAEDFVTSGTWGNPEDKAGQWIYEKLVLHYQIGAKSERTKTIDEITEVVNKAKAFGLIDANGIIETLESLKV